MKLKNLILINSAVIAFNPIFGCGSQLKNSQENTPPNVIIIITDDQGYGDLACNGNPYLKTPNLDKLSKEGIRLTNFHVNSTCSPTRASLMTGRYSIRSGVTSTIGGKSLIRQNEVTMADVFVNSGYRTGMFGKWHLGDNYPFRPEHRGFQEVVSHGGGGITQTPDPWGNTYFDDRYYHNGKPKQFTGYCTDVWFNEITRFIGDNSSKPFFAYLALNAPHAPFAVEEKYSAPYRNMGIPKGVANFYGMITNIDDNVGRLRRWLRDNDLEENTLLIFMGDNGSVIGDRGNGRAGSVFNFDGYNAGMRGAKGSMYDGGHRVPFFLYWPGGGFKGGKDISVLASGIDILPTLIKICGLRNPENVHLDGRDISPLLFGKKIKWSDRMIVITQGDRIGEKNFAVLSQDWRLVDGPGIETNLELYDINNDPGQKENVADQHVDVVKLMWEYLQRVCSEEIPKLKIENPIIIGNDAENPARLDAHDWHQTNNDIETARKFEYARTGEEKRAVLLPWHQYMIRDHAPLVNGYWVVEVEKAGSYEFTLRQQPAEARFPLEAVKARLQIGDVDITKDVPVQWESNFNYEYWNCTDAVTFTVNLEPGKTHLRTWLINEDGSSRGAYFVYIRRL